MCFLIQYESFWVILIFFLPLTLYFLFFVRVWVLCSIGWLHPSISSYSSWITRLQLPGAPHAWQLQSRPQHWRFCSTATWRHLKKHLYAHFCPQSFNTLYSFLITLSHFILSIIQTGNEWQRTATKWKKLFM